MSQYDLERVLTYWFGPVDGRHSALYPKLWFAGSVEYDREIERLFYPLFCTVIDSLSSASTDPDAHNNKTTYVQSVHVPSLLSSFAQHEWLRTPSGCIGMCLLFDQFPRNIFRGSASMFAFDTLAQHAASLLMQPDTQWHVQLPPPQRVFVYFVLAHSEQLAVTRQAVACMAALSAEERFRIPGNVRNSAKTYQQFLAKQLHMLELFGRLPYRNSLLGRPNTLPEDDWLATNKAGFIAAVQEKPMHASKFIGRPNGLHNCVYHAASDSSTSQRVLPPPKLPRLRIAVFHSFRQNARILRNRTERLKRKLLPIAELVYVNAPTRYIPTNETLDATLQVFGELYVKSSILMDWIGVDWVEWIGVDWIGVTWLMD
jgi:uncharacterized protein (DUF924 family)